MSNPLFDDDFCLKRHTQEQRRYEIARAKFIAMGDSFAPNERAEIACKQADALLAELYKTEEKQ